MSLILMILILSSLGYSTNLSAFPSLKPSSIDNKHDIPIGIPIETGTGTTGLSFNTKANLQNTTYSLESLPEELHLMESTVSTLASCEKLPVTSLAAIGNDGNIPSNVIDNNLNTRWSNNGVGSWIQLDLGSRKNICSVDIAWYRGTERQNDFIISVSDDGTAFTQKHSGTSSGTTTSPEKYALPAGSEGRYVKITVNGNTENEWASITEIAAYGDAASEGGRGGSPFPPQVTKPGPLYHTWQTSPGNAVWAAWSSLGGALSSNPATISNSDGRLEAFAVGANGKGLYHRAQTATGSSTWSTWTSLGGTIEGSPAVARNADGRLEVFAVGANGKALYHRAQASPGSSTWSAWTSLGGTLGSNPAVAVNSDGRLVVFAVGVADQLYYRAQTSPGSSSTWSAWTSLGGTIEGSPAVARNADGRLEVFAVGASGHALYHKWQTAPGSSTWSGWTSLGGSVNSNLSSYSINILATIAPSSSAGEFLHSWNSSTISLRE